MSICMLCLFVCLVMVCMKWLSMMFEMLLMYGLRWMLMVELWCSCRC